MTDPEKFATFIPKLYSRVRDKQAAELKALGTDLFASDGGSIKRICEDVEATRNLALVLAVRNALPHGQIVKQSDSAHDGPGLVNGSNRRSCLIAVKNERSFTSLLKSTVTLAKSNQPVVEQPENVDHEIPFFVVGRKKSGLLLAPMLIDRTGVDSVTTIDPNKVYGLPIRPHALKNIHQQLSQNVLTPDMERLARSTVLGHFVVQSSDLIQVEIDELVSYDSLATKQFLTYNPIVELTKRAAEFGVMPTLVGQLNNPYATSLPH